MIAEFGVHLFDLRFLDKKHKVVIDSLFNEPTQNTEHKAISKSIDAAQVTKRQDIGVQIRSTGHKKAR